MNYDNGLNSVLSDKNLFALVAKGVGIKTPNIYLCNAQGMLVGKDGISMGKAEAIERISNIGDAFCKPTIETNSGKGCFAVNMHNGFDIISGNSAKSIIESLGDNFAIQEKIICHEQVKRLHPNSCNTFRIITYRWKDQYYVCPSAMRIGVSGKCVDNANAGGIFVAIEPNGQLHRFAFRKNCEKFEYHPDTKIKFSETKIDGFTLCVNAALKLHQSIPQIGIVHWDFTLDQNNTPVVIEGNVRGGSLWIPQMGHGKGVFGERTIDILNWISSIEKTPLNKRSLKRFGK